ncbi:isoprenylcysteine carboxylmethyltransferase family protein [uncultured Aeromicrobium sp.]|uniref:methyltransferase family protein n=1 Tax=uncultured Aeromicrobium sp. TaxID=337820 RepID=UPI0025D7CEF7|nr:isoprenylcysteine carboxylmethyltransferase family protein [uncultured Aeromicrobium sp.]
MTRPIPPAALAAGAAAAQALMTRGRATTRGSRVLSAAIAAPSVYFLAGAVERFRRAGTTVDPRAGARANSLVTTGPSARSRHPMYVGMAGLLLAHAAARRSAAAVLPAAMFVSWVDRVQIPMEEAHLADRFGPEFEAYASSVRRWI